jgi:hypothetical protein
MLEPEGEPVATSYRKTRIFAFLHSDNLPPYTPKIHSKGPPFGVPVGVGMGGTDGGPHPKSICLMVLSSAHSHDSLPCASALLSDSAAV